MFSGLKNTYHRLLASSHQSTSRYLLQDFTLTSRLTGLIGARGTGKTTLLLQYINRSIDDKNTAIYLSLDNIYFTQYSLIDCVSQLYELDGVKVFFLDEVHKYPTWEQEIKNIYDSYPEISIVFSGSSSIDLVKGGYDLSRRAVLYHLRGMSFREYLEFKLDIRLEKTSLKELLENPNGILKQLEDIDRLQGHFNDYLLQGYYPFMFEDPENYPQKLLNVVNKTIFEDISNFYKLKTENLHHFRRILSYLATNPPGELKRNNISKHSGLDNKTVSHYLNILQETGLVCLVQQNKSGSGLLKHSEKIFLANANLYYVISKEIGFEFKVGSIREIFFINMVENSGNTAFYSKVGDFSVGDINFEIGGKSKSKKQIKNNLENSYLVKDNINYASGQEIPLYAFGFLY